MKRILISAVICVLCFSLGWMVRGGRIRDDVKTVQADTVFVTDTVRESYPVAVREEKIRTERVVVRDTVRVKDTLYLSLRHSKMFYATDEYYAEVSGYNPCLDYIEVYPKTRTISVRETIKADPSPWQYGVFVGLDYGWLWQNYISPNIGAEIEYKKVSLGIECGVNVGMKERRFESASPYLQFGVKYRMAGR